MCLGYEIPENQQQKIKNKKLEEENIELQPELEKEEEQPLVASA
ncbi:MAG: hypothetical protein K0S67_1482 [Nitrososphaeraceae archaeon]|jgi:hypothetical protein|nr:hypothetical protein [Nitrososphaeraceae archaeon]MDF2768745.1 hypothetical protein [Nitrososphaeraceae archaeon]HEX2407082.1 hypothetical protein [Nitrososphaeraceae archaeon]